MLSKQFPISLRRKPNPRQDGVMLLIAMIMLVAMTLAGIALVRSVYTTNIIAGNMGFKQAATNSADTGIETAIAWLETNNTSNNLFNDIPIQGYQSHFTALLSTQSWDNYWTANLQSAQVTAAADASGNTVSYAIERLCNQLGDPTSTATGIDCAVTPPTLGPASGSSKGAGVRALIYGSQVYYRITARVSGPRSTVSYVQALVAM